MNQWNDWERERYYREENQARQQRSLDQAAQNRMAFLQSRTGQQAGQGMGILLLIALPFYALHAAVERYSWAGIIFALIITIVVIYYLRSFLRTAPGRVLSRYVTLAIKLLGYVLAAVGIVAALMFAWKVTAS